MTTRRNVPLDLEEVEPAACTVDLRLQVLGRVPFFADLADTELAEINHIFSAHGYQAGEGIYYTGDAATRLYVVATGKVKLFRHTLDGQDVLLDILVAGEFFGSLDTLGDEAYPDTAQAQTDCCLLSITAEEFHALLHRYPPVAMRVLALTAERLKLAHETIRQLSAFSVAQRIAAVLLKLSEKVGEESDEGLLIQVPLARQDIAAMTGTTVESASRTLSRFRKDGLIRSGRQWIALVDVEGLEAVAAGP